MVVASSALGLDSLSSFQEGLFLSFPFAAFLDVVLGD
jgi:hypothetical protein